MRDRRIRSLCLTTSLSVLFVGTLAMGCQSTVESEESDASIDVIEDATSTETEDGAEDTGPEDSGVEDGTAPIEDSGGTTGEPDTSPPPDTKPAVASDGKLGASCESDANCYAGYTCSFGFCTQLCKDDTGAAIENTCVDVSNVTEFPGIWGCPSDFRICLPLGNGQSAGCKKTEDCQDKIGWTHDCTNIVRYTGSKVGGGVCLPTSDRKQGGEECSEAKECASLLCNNDTTTGADGVCIDHCQNNSHCTSGKLCVGVGYKTDPAQELPAMWVGLCIPREGSLQYCFKQSSCPGGEVCRVSVEPNGLGPQYHCNTGNEGGAAVGEPCTSDAACFSGFCMLDGMTGGPEQGYCSQNCQKDPLDCGEGSMGCAQLTLHANGTPEPEDDETGGACVYGAPGDLCGGSDAWCLEPYSTCDPSPDWPDTLGVCSEPKTSCADGGPLCNDGLSCTVDTCDEATGECTYTTLKEGACLIDGQCYSAGTSGSDPCEWCDPSLDALAWSLLADDSACDDGIACTDASCSEGVCLGAPTACDDGLPCTVDSCDETTDTCVAGLAEDHCLIGEVCYAGGTSNPANDCQGCDAAANAWAPLGDGTACDDGLTCTTSGQCEAGVCTQGSDTCDDELECTTESCDATQNQCVVTQMPGTCVIEGACVQEEAVHPENSCLSCDPLADATGWSNVADLTVCEDGSGCTTGDTCDAGQCVSGAACTEPAVCFSDACCTPTCAVGACGGSDGCGGTCGCPEADVCVDGSCCEPQCQDKDCGPDGCGGECGSCTEPSVCTEAGVCSV